jgi:hypothetical protein
MPELESVLSGEIQNPGDTQGTLGQRMVADRSNTSPCLASISTRTN